MRKTTAAERMAAKLAERKKAECSPDEYEADITSIVQELTTSPPQDTSNLSDVIRGLPGKHRLVLKEANSMPISKFMIFSRGALLLGHLQIPKTSKLPGPSLFGPCVVGQQLAIIFDIGTQVIATLYECGKDIQCGLTSFKYIDGIKELFARYPANAVNLTAIRLIHNTKLIICLTRPHDHCKKCAIFNAFEFDLSENRLKQIGGQYPSNNYIKNAPVGRNVITSICELGYITNIWDEVGCNHFPRKADWGQLNQGKFIDAYSRFVILKSIDKPRGFELYEGGKPLLTFDADQALFDSQGFIWLRFGTCVTCAGITRDRKLMIIAEYSSCEQLLRIGARLLIKPAGEHIECNEIMANQNYLEYMKIACTL